MFVSWFSTGVSSFIATYIMRSEIDLINYCYIEDQHKDSIRFLTDCAGIMRRDIHILNSPYMNVNNVIRQFRFVNSPYGAKCTDILKRRVRKEFEHGKKDLTYIWGIDAGETDRADKIVEANPQQNHVFPLIEKGLSKADCHGMLKHLKIERPAMYKMGYNNNNCVGCVKGGMGYWNKIREDFPNVFNNRSIIEREIGRTCIKGLFLDELLPGRGRMSDEIIEDCGITCELNL